MTHLCDSCIYPCKEYGSAIISCLQYENFAEDYFKLRKRVKKLEDGIKRILDTDDWSIKELEMLLELKKSL